jgi:protein tyrosine phosphatase (PTP) superfamily phosphohydrolase (DUF442 family)
MELARVIVVSIALVALVGCESETRRIGSTSKAPSPQKLATAHLPNAWRLHEKVISGGQPDGEAAFRELKQLGVKTIISVDGAKPDVELARKHGLRYVHLPHGYDGIPEKRAKELAKAVRDLDGPIYIHCHHGRHRSPAAAAVACVSAGFIEPSSAVGVLKAAGTSEHYRGLYQSAESARRLDDALLDLLHAEFPETASLPPLAEAMVELERTHDHLKAIAESGWKTPLSDPDLDPPHEALLLKEQFAELFRADDVQRRPKRFRKLLAESEMAANQLESALREGSQTSRAAAALERISQNCTDCHRQFRDVPLREKSRQE